MSKNLVFVAEEDSGQILHDLYKFLKGTIKTHEEEILDPSNLNYMDNAVLTAYVRNLTRLSAFQAVLDQLEHLQRRQAPASFDDEEKE